MTDYTPQEMAKFPWTYQDAGQPSTHSLMVDQNGEYRTSFRTIKDGIVALEAHLDAQDKKLDAILAQLSGGGQGTPGNFTITLSGEATPQ